MSIESVFEIQHLIYKYAELIDSGNYEGIGELFSYGRITTEDPNKRGKADPENPGFRGAKEILKMYQDSTRIYPDGTPKSKHIVTNLIVDVSPDDQSGSARSYYTVLQKTVELALQPVITGRYIDSFSRIKADSNKWHFLERIMIMDQIGDLSQHLLFEIPDPDKAPGHKPPANS